MRTMRAQLTPRELDVTAAWWHTGTVVEAAKLLELHEQTAKNVLYTARLRSGAPTTLALALMFRERIEALDVRAESARSRGAERLRHGRDVGKGGGGSRPGGTDGQAEALADAPEDEAADDRAAGVRVRRSTPRVAIQAEKNRARARAYAQKVRAVDPAEIRRRAIYERLVERYGALCQICGRVPEPGRRLSIDHDHVTGEIRGLLCKGCNYGLGCLKDSPALIDAAKAYLGREQHTGISFSEVEPLQATQDHVGG